MGCGASKPEEGHDGRPLPPGWIAQRDERTGKVSYVNKDLKKTQFVHPGDDAGATANVGFRLGATNETYDNNDAGASAGAGAPATSDGIYDDDDAGVPLYDDGTGEDLYAHPAGAFLAEEYDDDEDLYDDPDNLDRDNNYDQVDMSSVPRDKGAVEDDGYMDLNYDDKDKEDTYMDVEEVVEPPGYIEPPAFDDEDDAYMEVDGAFPPSSPSQSQAEAGDQSQQQSNLAGVPVAAKDLPMPLPEDWIARRNDRNKIFYVHKGDKKTQWVHPTEVQMAQAMPVQAAVPGVWTPLPAGWEQRLSRNKIPYFVNHITNTTQWIDPRPLPDNWEHKLTAVGRVFYIDHNNKSTQWFHPCAPPHQRFERKTDKNGRAFWVDHQTKSTSWHDPRRSRYEAKRTTDGRTFWIDHATQSTSWQRPAGAPVMARAVAVPVQARAVPVMARAVAVPMQARPVAQAVVVQQARPVAQAVVMQPMQAQQGVVVQYR